MLRNAFEVVGLGEVLWDLFPDGKVLGGAPTNFAAHARAQGAGSVLVSSVGDDALGREALTRLANWGVDQRYLAADPTHPTGTVSVTLDAQGIPEYVITEDVAWDYIPWTVTLEDLAARADAVCFGSLCQRSPVSRATIQRFLAGTRSDALRVFDLNLRPTGPSLADLAETLAAANVLKLNVDELPVLAAHLDLVGDARTQLEGLAERLNLQVIALTRGPRGSILFTPYGVFDHPGYPVQVVDTVGAGDAFTATLVVGLLKGEDPATVNDRANAVASAVCAHPGAIPDLGNSPGVGPTS